MAGDPSTMVPAAPEVGTSSSASGATGAVSAVTETAEPVSEGEAALTGGSVESETEAAPEVTADSFGWDDWDGSADSLPEPVRGWGSKLSARYEREAKEARAEAEKSQKIWESLMEGREDPRVAEYQAKLDEWSGKDRTWTEQIETTKSEFAAYQAEVEKHFEAQARAKVEEYKSKNAWIFESDELQKAGLDLLNEGFEQDDLPVLLRMPEPIMARAREINADLVKKGASNASDYAIKLARSEAQIPKISTSASLVGGSDPATSRNSETVPADQATGATLHEFTLSALDRSLRKLNRN